MSSMRSIIFLLTGIVLLAAAHLAIDFSGHGKRHLERRRTLCSAAAGRVGKITVTRCGEPPTELERGDSGWRIVSPFSAVADESAVNRLLDALAYTPISEAAFEAELFSMGKERTDFALDTPVTAVTVSGNGLRETVSIGAPTPTADGVYADVSGVNAVFVIPPSVLAALDVSAENFRRRSLFDSMPSTIVSFGVRRGQGEVAMFVHGENGWSSDGGIVSAEKVKSFLSALVSTEAKGFVWPVGATNETATASEALLAVYGLDPESAVTVTLKDAAGVESQISFGKDAGDGLAYARVQNGTAVVTVPATLKESAAGGPSQFRDMRLFQVDMRNVTAFTIADGPTSYALTRTAEGAWRLESPIAAPADKNAVGEMLARILALTTADTEKDGMTISLSPGTKQAAVSRRSVLGTGRFEGLRSREAIRIDPALVRRIVRTAGKDTMSVVYSRDRRTWGMETGNKEGVVNMEAVKAILSALAPLEAGRIEKLKVSAADLAMYGLDDPTLMLSIDQDREDAVRRNLIFGKQAAGGGRYATVGSSDAVFVISDSAADTLSRPIVSFDR